MGRGVAARFALTLWLLLVCVLVGAGVARAGDVDLVASYDSDAFDDADRAAIDALFADFEALLVGTAPGTATILVRFVAGGTDAYASTFSNWVWADVEGEWFLATNTWAKVVRGAPLDDAWDMELRWNFQLSSPHANVGLVRHELLHGFGAVSNLDPAEVTLGLDGLLTKLGIGERVALTVYDRALLDADDAALCGNYDAVDRTFEILDFAVESAIGSWDDRKRPGDGTGVRFRGVDDAGLPFDIPIAVFGLMLYDWSHPMDVMYASARPNDWAALNDADRALLRGLGYRIAMPEPGATSLAAIAALVALARRRAR